MVISTASAMFSPLMVKNYWTPFLYAQSFHAVTGTTGAGTVSVMPVRDHVRS